MNKNNETRTSINVTGSDFQTFTQTTCLSTMHKCINCKYNHLYIDLYNVCKRCLAYSTYSRVRLTEMKALD